MNFTELTEDNYVLFAIKYYDNPSAVTKEDFLDDLRRFKYIKRLINKYLKNGEVKLHLLLNHIIIVYNVFNEAATPLLFFKMDKEYWSIIKSIMIFLERYPSVETETLKQIPINEQIIKELKSL
ncbi:MAG: hypothetical protein CM15mV23_1130 [Eurybiavirus sp.]|nr:MAG: hypothetical protein CM15mV23_1130 [Eurybiavirus sp.]